MEKPKIEIRGLKKSFDEKVVLDELDLDIFRGESLVILGRSGAGKSILIKTISTLMAPDAGTIKIDGQEITKLGETKRFLLMDKFGFLFQNSALFDSMTIWENVAFKLLHSRKINSTEARKIALEKLKIVDLDEKVADLYPNELSGGMQKRVAIARAIICNPEIIFFDEPTTGLDPITANKINLLIIKTIELSGATAITITHDVHSANLISSRIALLDNGKICWEGTKDNLYNSNNRQINNFIGGIE
jgi:phospholipid/cholesterol/gamma-HCH transport system ATP-binding protein